MEKLLIPESLDPKKPDRRSFLKAAGLGSLAFTALSSQVFGQREIRLVEPLTAGRSLKFIRERLRLPAVQTIMRALNEQGLISQLERSKAFTVLASDSRQVITIGILPFVAEDLSGAGGISISQGGLAAGGSILRDGTDIVQFSTYVLVRGELRVETFDVGSCQDLDDALSRAADLARKDPAYRERPIIELDMTPVNVMSSFAYGELVTDASSRRVHTPEEISALLSPSNVRIVETISQWIVIRATSSPGGCCCCACSCWGCSSSCCCWG